MYRSRVIVGILVIWCGLVSWSGIVGSPGANALQSTEPARTHSATVDDCVAVAEATDSRRSITFVAWCSVQPGNVRFGVRTNDDEPIVRYSKRLDASSGGPKQSSTCRLTSGRLVCKAHKTGPVTLRGAIETQAGESCSAPVAVVTGSSIFLGLPIGCPGTHPERLGGLAGTRAFRTSLGLDLDLRSRDEHRRRYSQLRQAWRHGNPVARYSLDTYSALLRAADIEELEFRERYIAQASSVIPRWAAVHAPDTYAGLAVDFRKYGGTIFVGFTDGQNARVAELQREAGLLAPNRIEALPASPTYSLTELRKLQGEVVAFFTDASNRSRRQLVIAIGVNVLDNRVQVTSSHVAKLEALLSEEFGSSAPIEAVFSKAFKIGPASD